MRIVSDDRLWARSARSVVLFCGKNPRDTHRHQEQQQEPPRTSTQELAHARNDNKNRETLTGGHDNERARALHEEKNDGLK
jgi:hypothetical protein